MLAGAVVALRPETGLASEVPADLRPMQGFQYPIEIHENGKVKTLIVAGEVIPGDPKDAIHARRVRVEFFDEAGRATGLIKVDECRYWRDKGRVESDSDIYLDKDGILITGRGLEWTIKEQRIIIRENVKIVLTRSGGPPGTVASPGRAGTGKRTTHAD
jgi:hypothetical protein